MLTLANLDAETCSGGYPCNPAGYDHDSAYNTHGPGSKALWAEMWVR